jgi:molybdopterin-guanine dinucleotide biosynthesis protein A
VLACDLVTPHPDAISAVVAHAASHDVDVAVPVIGGRRHLHHAVWRAGAAPSLRAAFDAGERAPRRAVARLRVGEVTGIDPAALRDADDPGTLATVRAVLEARRSSRGHESSRTLGREGH